MKILTPHQYMILRIILKSKSYSGPKLRKLLNYSGPKYYNFMNRMVKANLITKEYKNHCECEYTITQNGIQRFKETKEFYR